MHKVLMPKAVALWLIENTSLTFKQIADFCSLHILEVEALAEETASTTSPLSPVYTGELTKDEITRAEKDPSAKLEYSTSKELEGLEDKHEKHISSKFKKQHKPEVALWLIQNYPLLSNYQIAKLISVTSNLIKNVRDKTHWNYANLKPKNPVTLGYCTEEELLTLINKVQAKENNKEAL